MFRAKYKPPFGSNLATIYRISKFLYNCLNRIPLKIQFELKFKLFMYGFFQLGERQQKINQNYEISAICFQKLEFFAIFFIFAIFPKKFEKFFKVSVG